MDKVQLEYVDCILGEKEFHIPALGLAQSEVWRTAFMAEVTEILAFLKSQSGAFEGLDMGDLRELAGANVFDLLPVIGLALNKANVSMNQLGELILLYGLEDEREYILKHTTMKQAIVALWEMAKLEYPFGLIQSQIQARTGLKEDTTSPS